MRVAQVTGLTGEGIVAEIHETESAEALQAFLNARQIAARAIPAEDARVVVGTSYDGESFVFPPPSVITEPEPTTPEPPSVAEIVAQLDSLRRQAINSYISEWGQESKEELWPVLDPEMARAATETAQTLVVASYPAIAGFVIESQGIAEPTPAHILGAAAGLRENKVAHVRFLRRTEQIRRDLRDEYAALSDEDKLTWSAQTRWVWEVWGLAV
jgi:hypothetical protein